ncbi:DJ-1/PfpI family protein [Colletotrichum sublineola]|uniref:Putative DJ-1/PfpI family protein n=1 Tax=Colletotrichum sublineola TaxID=1173701 RepID=A0A066WZ16_COLSU|nr:DJ-1/PfpI family protein [Colletotrichum sublineola]KDN62138.1 putative DJ-1/PfpI family protein [Colletotrichum sublineola]
MATTLTLLVAGNPFPLLLPQTHRPFRIPATNTTSPPVNIGTVVFRAMDMLDIFGPLDALQLVAKNRHLNLHLIAATLDPVTTAPQAAGMNAYNSSFWPTIQPTATFDDDLDLDVLLIPGGPGIRAPGLEPIVDYVKRYYPRVKYLISICTGASFAARSGVLDGKRATTNKASWKLITDMGPKVKWVSPARYVNDGNVWTSSGVSSGLDLIMAFIDQVYGEEMATKVGRIMEYIPNDSDWDPFADINGVTPTGHY